MMPADTNHSIGYLLFVLFILASIVVVLYILFRYFFRGEPPTDSARVKKPVPPTPNSGSGGVELLLPYPDTSRKLTSVGSNTATNSSQTDKRN